MTTEDKENNSIKDIWWQIASIASAEICGDDYSFDIEAFILECESKYNIAIKKEES